MPVNVRQAVLSDAPPRPRSADRSMIAVSGAGAAPARHSHRSRGNHHRELQFSGVFRHKVVVGGAEAAPVRIPHRSRRSWPRVPPNGRRAPGPPADAHGRVPGTAARAAGRRCHPCSSGGGRNVGRHGAPPRPRRAVDAAALLGLPRRRTPADRGGADVGGLAVGRATIHGLRSGRGLPPRVAAGAGPRRRDRARRAPPPTRARCALAPPRPTTRGPGLPGRAAGDRAWR